MEKDLHGRFFGSLFRGLEHETLKEKIMQNDNSFGSRIAATWRALVEHMECLSSAEQDGAGSPKDPFDFIDPDGRLGNGGLGGVML